MKYQAILFDLDGTLLPMDLEQFTTTYFGLLSRRFPEYDPKAFVSGIWQGTKAMIQNDGSMTNEARFWQTFTGLLGQEIRQREPEFADFYETDFHKAKAVTGENPLAAKLVEQAHEQAEKVILATNPLFPECGVRSRLSWVGLKSEDFDLVTTYENFSVCKPKADYYRQICGSMNLVPERCLMVGNDLQEDGWGASQIGMSVQIVTDCLITHGLKLEDYPHSTFAELVEHGL